VLLFHSFRAITAAEEEEEEKEEKEEEEEEEENTIAREQKAWNVQMPPHGVASRLSPYPLSCLPFSRPYST